MGPQLPGIRTDRSADTAVIEAFEGAARRDGLRNMGLGDQAETEENEGEQYHRPERCPGIADSGKPEARVPGVHVCLLFHRQGRHSKAVPSLRNQRQLCCLASRIAFRVASRTAFAPGPCVRSGQIPIACFDLWPATWFPIVAESANVWLNWSCARAGGGCGRAWSGRFGNRILMPVQLRVSR